MTHELTSSRYEPIENYGIIGNLHTVALVSRNGSIDFMSFTRFDSPTLFCKILDADKGGCFALQPEMKDIITKQLYLPDTNVLVTRFLAEEGIAEVIDYMPINEDENNCAIVRKVKTVRGNITYKMSCSPRFNYANEKHTLKKEDDCYVFTPGHNFQPDVHLSSDVELTIDGDDATANFTLSEGASACFVLEAANNKNHREKQLTDFVNRTYHETINYWQNWIAKSTYKGVWKEIVNRSALALKLLFSIKYGSMVAAATFSLPESIGYGRNWDYRFTWIRDAAFSMHAFLQLGFMEEAQAFLGWIKKQSTDKELQLMFAVDGNTHLDEKELPHLEGYKKSRPVRIGNGASTQTQMDIYGELLETVYIYAIHGGDLSYDYWQIITEYVELVINNWHQPDHSIWEVRGEKENFCFHE